MRTFSLAALGTSTLAIVLSDEPVGAAERGNFDLYWDDLNYDDRMDWSKLGWDHISWNDESAEQPMAATMGWSDLESMGVSQYAWNLGYTPMTWNWEAPSQETTIT